jgi:hypothetical protein
VVVLERIVVRCKDCERREQQCCVEGVRVEVMWRRKRQFDRKIFRRPNAADEGNEALGNGLLVNEGKKALVVSVAAKSLWFIARAKPFGGRNRRSAVER